MLDSITADIYLLVWGHQAWEGGLQRNGGLLYGDVLINQSESSKFMETIFMGVYFSTNQRAVS